MTPMRPALSPTWLALALLLLTFPARAFAQEEPSPTTDEAPASEGAEEDELPRIDALTEPQQRELANLIELGETTSARGELEKSLSYFQDAYRLFPHPQLLYRIGSLQDQLERYQEAADNLATFASMMPDAPEASSARRRALELRELLQQQARTQNVQIGSLRVFSTPPGAQVYLDDTASRLKGSTPTVDIPVSEPRTYKVIVRKEGYLQKEERVEVTPGDRKVVRVSLERDPAYAPDLGAQGSTRKKKRGAAPWVLLGVGAAGATTAVIAGIDWQRHDMGPNKGDYPNASAFERKKRSETITYIGAGVAVVGLAGATVLFLTRSPAGSASVLPTPQDRAVSVSPWFGRGSGGASVEWRF